MVMGEPNIVGKKCLSTMQQYFNLPNETFANLSSAFRADCAFELDCVFKL